MDNAAVAEQGLEKKKKKKKDKVRSAWISFAGRIVAQMVGAIATVALGVMVLHRYTDTRPPGHPPAAELGHAAYAQPGYSSGPPPAALGGGHGQQPVVIVVSPGMLAMHDAAERRWSPDRSCAPALDLPATSAAHLDNGTFLSR